jgi:hypothetical protein
MSNRLAWLIVGLVLVAAGPAQAQVPRPLPANPPVQFQSWQPAMPIGGSINPAVGQFAAPSPNRKRHALIGGALGALAGVAFCTAVSTLADDSADGGLSTCPLDSYLLFAAGGFALGFTIGWAI